MIRIAKSHAETENAIQKVNGMALGEGQGEGINGRCRYSEKAAAALLLFKNEQKGIIGRLLRGKRHALQEGLEALFLVGAGHGGCCKG